MKKLNKVDSYDIRNIFNASYRKREKVNQFGQAINNPNLLERVHLIDTLDILIDLYMEAEEVYDLTSFGMHDLSNTNFDWLEEYEVDAINTFNWSSPLTNDIDFRVYKVENNLFLSIAVQNGYSDIRCGYMIEFLFKFDLYYSDDWYTIFSEIPSYSSSFIIEEYSFDFNIFSEAGVYSIYKLDGTYEEYDAYIGEYEDCEKYIETLKEEYHEEL